MRDEIQGDCAGVAAVDQGNDQRGLVWVPDSWAPIR